MYQKPMKGVIGSHFKFKELYPWPNRSSNIWINKVIGNDMERLKVESKWSNLHIFWTFHAGRLKVKYGNRPGIQWICVQNLNYVPSHILWTYLGIHKRAGCSRTHSLIFYKFAKFENLQFFGKFLIYM